LNGFPIRELGLRRRNRRVEIIVRDQEIGCFAIHPGFEIQVKDLYLAKALLGTRKDDGWHHVGYDEVMDLVLAGALAGDRLRTEEFSGQPASDEA
jgi:hypothetical protein